MIFKTILAGMLLLLINFSFVFATASAQEEDIGLIPCQGLDCGVCDIFELISNVINFAVFTIAAPLGVGILIYGGIMLITSGGNEGKKSKGSGAIWAAVVGLVITFAAWVIVNTVLGVLADKDFSESWYSFSGCE